MRGTRAVAEGVLQHEKSGKPEARRDPGISLLPTLMQPSSNVAAAALPTVLSVQQPSASLRQLKSGAEPLAELCVCVRELVQLRSGC